MGWAFGLSDKLTNIGSQIYVGRLFTIVPNDLLEQIAGSQGIKIQFTYPKGVRGTTRLESCIGRFDQKYRNIKISQGLLQFV